MYTVVNTKSKQKLQAQKHQSHKIVLFLKHVNASTQQPILFLVYQGRIYEREYYFEENEQKEDRCQTLCLHHSKTFLFCN